MVQREYRLRTVLQPSVTDWTNLQTVTSNNMHEL